MLPAATYSVNESPDKAADLVEAARDADKVVDAVQAVNKADDAVGVAAQSNNGKKIYVTYTKTNPETGKVYSGRASGTGTPAEVVAKRDKNHHMNDKGYGPAVLDKASTNPDAIRGQEQYMIELNGGAKSSGGTSGNSINGISPKNPNKNKYEDARKKYL